MNYRLNRTVIILVALLVVIAIGLFAYTLTTGPKDTDQPEPINQEEVVAVPEKIISGKHQFKDNIHTIAGMVALPTPCHNVVVEPFFVDNTETTTVELRFTSVLEGEGCAAVVSDAPYKVTFEAPENADIQATWNSEPVRLNLIPIGPDESLDEEFFFKG